jgi:hypothetical protein
MGMKRNTSTMGLAGMGGETSGLIMKKSSSEDDLQVHTLQGYILKPYRGTSSNPTGVPPQTLQRYLLWAR